MVQALGSERPEVTSGDGHAGVVIEGVHKVERARTFRELVSNYGVLTTGTLIVGWTFRFRRVIIAPVWLNSRPTDALAVSPILG